VGCYLKMRVTDGQLYCQFRDEKQRYEIECHHRGVMIVRRPRCIDAGRFRTTLVRLNWLRSTHGYEKLFPQIPDNQRVLSARLVKLTLMAASDAMAC
jgi:hypothetical protein